MLATMATVTAAANSDDDDDNIFFLHAILGYDEHLEKPELIEVTTIESILCRCN